MAISCILVMPKRKMAGRLEIKKKTLHFFGDFLVEGTGGSSVLEKHYSSSKSDPSQPEHFGGQQKQKLLKWPLDVENFNVGENSNSVITQSDQKQKCVKRHRWWNLSKV